MAKNLQSKLKPTDKVSIFDINEEAVRRLEIEMKAGSNGAGVEVAASAFDASKHAVSFTRASSRRLALIPIFPNLLHDDHFCSIYDLSWGQLVDSSLALF